MYFPFLPRIAFSSFTTDFTDRTDSVLWEKEEIKKFVPFPGLTPLQPDAYAQTSKRAPLSDSPHPSGLPCWQTGNHQNKIAALGSTKRLPWSHNDILCLVRGSALSCGVLPSRQQYRVQDYPGTPPLSVYQVTHGTALQAA